eukprot:TRINITY_DN46474_c0_g1_i4.p1 TRINITY_DN46474_c0_g1~~TRINITY_DN46474_c0_g1_i4.p1  ORF type:complete len:347 (-),score=95.04 TRINITY_DN46474_c0_g1_i4:93-1133(-)
MSTRLPHHVFVSSHEAGDILADLPTQAAAGRRQPAIEHSSSQPGLGRRSTMTRQTSFASSDIETLVREDSRKGPGKSKRSSLKRKGVVKKVSSFQQFEERRRAERASLEASSMVSPSAGAAISKHAAARAVEIQASLKQLRSAASSEFVLITSAAKRYGYSVDEVRTAWEEFHDLSERSERDGRGALQMEQFQKAIRRRCNVADGMPLPVHLLNSEWLVADRDGSGAIDFEEFLLWAAKTQFSEEVLVSCPEERAVRQVARKLELNILDVERVKRTFAKFDVDKSGLIEWEEFRAAVHTLLGIKNAADVADSRLRRLWREADADNDGHMNFEQFVTWYFRAIEKPT